MKKRKLLIRFIKDVIEENGGIYLWNRSPGCIAGGDWLKERDSDLWREDMLEYDWMNKNPYWNIFRVGMFVLNNDGEERYVDNMSFLVDNDMSVDDFLLVTQKDYDNIHIQSVHILKQKDGFYENLEEPIGKFKNIRSDEDKILYVSMEEGYMAFNQDLFDELEL